MKTLTTLLALALFCATGYGQTIKALGYDTASGEVVANTGTNVLTFTNRVEATALSAFQLLVEQGTNTYFNAGDDTVEVFVPLELFNPAGIDFKGTNAAAAAANTRTNLGLGKFLVTEDDIAVVMGATTNPALLVDGDTLFVPNAITFGSNAIAATRTNLGLGATWLTNTNVTNFRTAIGLGATNQVTFAGVNVQEILVTTYIDFDDPSVAAETRTNLGLPLPALTNTSNVTMMRALAGSTNTNAPFSGSVVVDTNTLVFTNGILLEVQ